MEGFERKLNELAARKDKNPEYDTYMNVVHAYILSRLGPRWGEQALSLYRKAVKKFPNNYEWLIGMAMMIGRGARHQMKIIGWKYPLPEHVAQKFEEEKTTLEDILRLKPNFHHARALYGQVCFNLNTKDPKAGEEIYKALEGGSRNQNICTLAARFYRKRKFFVQAEELLQDLVNELM